MSPLRRFFHPVVASRALGAKPQPVTVAGERYVLFRDKDGRPGALLDRCPHRFAPLSAGWVRPDGRLACPYHGWHFDRDGRGQSPTQPTLTRCDVEALQVEERYGYLWIAGPEVPREQVPNFAWDGFSFAGAFSMRFAAPLHVSLDNFSEDEHTPFVHSRLGWREHDCGTVSYEAKNFDDHTEVHYRAQQRPSTLLGLAGLRPGDIFYNDWETYFTPVHSVYRISWTAPDGTPRPLRITAAIYMLPEEAQTTRFHVFNWISIDGARASWLLRALRAWMGSIVTGLVWKEVWDDARFIPTVAQTPASMRGMRLGRFDKPLVHNRKLLDRIYWNRAETPHEG